MKKFTIYVWLNDQTTKKQIVSKKAAMSRIQTLVASHFGGWTISPAKWVFKHEDGKIVIEESIRIETLDFGFDDGAIAGFCDLIKREFNQESILIETEEKNVVFA